MNKLSMYAACSVLAALLMTTAAAAADRSPYGGTPVQIPGTIQAENFDEGGEGVAYHDTDPGNNGNTSAIRDTDVDVEFRKHGEWLYDTAAYVGWTRAGEWLEYTVNVQEDGDYRIEAQVASLGEGGLFKVNFDGDRLLGSELVKVDDTDGWNNWRLVAAERTVHLTAGLHVMRLSMEEVGPSGSVANFDWIRLTPSVTTLPGKIEAEQFNGGAESGYHDNDNDNSGGFYRHTAVDIDYFVDPLGTTRAYYVGWTEVGEWLEYSINVPTAGLYEVQARIASLGTGGSFHIEIDGVDKTGPISVPDTGGWRSWAILPKGGISIASGAHKVRVVLDSVGASGGVANFDWFRFLPQDSAEQPYAGAFYGLPLEIPGSIFPVDFDLGGEGVAYHDTDVVNDGGYYRAGGVDIDWAPSYFNDGAYLGWTRAGEWLKYTVNVRDDGIRTFDLEAMVASAGQGGVFHIEMDGVDKTGPIEIFDTGGWRNWRATYRRGIPLAPGTHVMRIVMDSVGPSGSVGNIARLWFTGSSDVNEGPYGFVAPPIPGTIEAEYFDNGDEGVAYHDTDGGNNGGACRTGGVDIDKDGAGCYVGWTRAGEWLNYTVNVQAPDWYLMEARVASEGEGGTFHVTFDGVDKSGPISVPDTGGWQTWTLIGRRVFLDRGQTISTMRISMDSVGLSGSVANIDWIRFTKE